MPVSGKEQLMMQASIDLMFEEKNDEIILQFEKEAKEIIVKASEESYFGLPDPQTRKDVDMSIEFLVRVEGTRRGKGWLWRTKRRAQLVREYFKPGNEKGHLKGLQRAKQSIGEREADEWEDAFKALSAAERAKNSTLQMEYDRAAEALKRQQEYEK